MPKMSYDMQQGTVVRWLKDEGEQIVSGEVIAEIETDKATVEMPAYINGVMGRIVVETGRSVPVGELIAIITQQGETLPPLTMQYTEEVRRSIPRAGIVSVQRSHSPACGLVFRIQRPCRGGQSFAHCPSLGARAWHRPDQNHGVGARRPNRRGRHTFLPARCDAGSTAGCSSSRPVVGSARGNAR